MSCGFLFLSRNIQKGRPLPGGGLILRLLQPLIVAKKFEDFAATQHPAGHLLGITCHKHTLFGDVGGVNRRPLGEHPSVDQFIQHTDGQRSDVFGPQIVQDQKIRFLAGVQPFVAAVKIKVFPPNRAARAAALV